MDLVNEKIDKYRSLLGMLPDNTERYKFLVDIAKKAPAFPEEYRLDNFKVTGCLSKIWLVPKFENGLVNYLADSEAQIIKGVVIMISDIYSGSSPEYIVGNDRNLMEELQLGNILSMNRRNGAYNMLLTVKEHAKLFKRD